MCCKTTARLRLKQSVLWIVAIVVFSPMVSPGISMAQGIVMQAEAVQNRTSPVGYEDALLRLSEVMGALSYLRTLCGASDAPEWQRRMSALIDSESRDAEIRSRISGAFNQGYDSFSTTHRVCTPAAQLAVTRYLDEGERLSRAIAARYGG